MKYTLCRFEYGYSGDFYQLSNEEGFVCFMGLDGNEMLLTPPYGYFVIDNNPPIPEWGII